MGCGHGSTQDCDPILVPSEGVDAYEPSESIGGLSALSGYRPDVLVSLLRLALRKV